MMNGYPNRKGMMMNLEEIKQAVRDGKTVCWSNDGYIIDLFTFASGEENWSIICQWNDHCIGLVQSDGITMNGEEKDFYIKS